MRACVRLRRSDVHPVRSGARLTASVLTSHAVVSKHVSEDELMLTSSPFAKVHASLTARPRRRLACGSLEMALIATGRAAS